MKNFLLTYAMALLAFAASAQCTVNPSVQTTPGVNPTAPNCPCIVRNVQYNQTLQGKIQATYDTTFGGFVNVHVVIDSVRLDSITGLPQGITWTKTPNVLAGGGNGAVCFSGTTSATAGTYNLTGYGTVWMHVTAAPFMTDSPMTTTGNLNQYSPFGNYYLEVTEPGVSCHGSTIGYGVSFTQPQPVCSGTQVTVNPQVNGGQSPYTYAWASTGNTLSCNNCAAPSATITQNSTYTVTVTDNTNATATASVTYTTTTPVTPAVSISGGNGTYCSGDVISFTATPTNGGPNATYQWLVNSNAAGTGATFTSGSLLNGDLVSVVLTSSLSCVTSQTATSNNVAVNYANAIVTQPADVTTGTGTNAVFSVLASNINSTYQWQLNTGTGFAGLSNAGPYSGVNTSTLTVTNVNSNFDNYLFRCVVTAAGCEDTTDEVLLRVTTGIGNISVASIAVYPNPAKNNISFNLNEEIKQIDIYQLQGAFVKSVTPTMQNGMVQVDISELSTGMYFVQVKADKTYRGNFVKE